MKRLIAFATVSLLTVGPALAAASEMPCSASLTNVDQTPVGLSIGFDTTGVDQSIQFSGTDIVLLVNSKISGELQVTAASASSGFPVSAEGTKNAFGLFTAIGTGPNAKLVYVACGRSAFSQTGSNGGISK